MSISTTTLSAAIGSTDISFVLASVSNINTPNFQTATPLSATQQYIKMGDEMSLVTGVNTTTKVVNVIRGQLGTQAATHGASEEVLIGAPSDFPNFQPAQGVTVAKQNRTIGIAAPVAAAATLVPTGPLFHVTGTTASSLVTLPSNWINASFTVIADAIWTWTSSTNSGGFAQAGTVTALGSTVTFTYDAATALWYPSRLA